MRSWRDEGVLFAYESSKQEPNKLYSFDESSLPQGVRLDPSEALEAAREEFGSRTFKSGELSNFLISRGWSQTQIKQLISLWRDEGVLFAYQSKAGKRDTNKVFSFDESSLPQGVRPVATGNGETYGEVPIFIRDTTRAWEHLTIGIKGVIHKRRPRTKLGTVIRQTIMELKLPYIQMEA